jgi:DNA-binding LytR/AlgR family response regulator
MLILGHQSTPENPKITMKKFFARPQICDPMLLWFNHGKLSVQPDEVVYLSSLENYTKFHLANSQTFISSRTMKLHEDQLSTKGQFVRLHRKFLLNLKFLLGFETTEEGKFACLSTGERLYVSRRKSRRFP